MNFRERQDLDRHITGNYGEDSVGDEEALNEDVKTLLRAVYAVLRYGMEANRRERLVDAADAVDAWFESQDPRSMGWVDDRGRP